MNDEANEADNSTGWVTGGIFLPDTRTEEERRRDSRRHARRLFIIRWKWRLRGLLPRGWKDDEDY